jgi:hypothetical protein
MLGYSYLSRSARRLLHLGHGNARWAPFAARQGSTSEASSFAKLASSRRLIAGACFPPTRLDFRRWIVTSMFLIFSATERPESELQNGLSVILVDCA